jgi:hypothetical protein
MCVYAAVVKSDIELLHNRSAPDEGVLSALSRLAADQTVNSSDEYYLALHEVASRKMLGDCPPLSIAVAQAVGLAIAGWLERTGDFHQINTYFGSWDSVVAEIALGLEPLEDG